MTESLRLVLVHDVDMPIASDRAQTLSRVGLPLRLERVEQRSVRREVRVDRRLRPAAHDHDVITAGAERLVDHDLDRGLIPDREQLLRNGFGGGEETCPQTSRGNDSAADLHGSDDILLRSMPTYVYKFVDTGETIEVQQGFHDDNLTEIAHPDSGEILPVKKVFTPVGRHVQGLRVLQDRQPRQEVVVVDHVDHHEGVEGLRLVVVRQQLVVVDFGQQLLVGNEIRQLELVDE